MKTQKIINGVLARESLALKSGDKAEANEMREIADRMLGMHEALTTVGLLKYLKGMDSLETFLPTLISLDLKEKYPSLFGNMSLPLNRLSVIDFLRHLIGQRLHELGYSLD